MILPPVFVGEVVLDGGGQVEVVDLSLLDSLLVDVLTNHAAAKVHQRKRLGIESADVFHCDFTVAPDGGDGDVQLLAAEASECRTQVLALNDEAHHALVHVEHHKEFVWNNK